jgi:hypothetical protein
MSFSLRRPILMPHRSTTLGSTSPRAPAGARSPEKTTAGLHAVLDAVQRQEPARFPVLRPQLLHR